MREALTKHLMTFICIYLAQIDSDASELAEWNRSLSQNEKYFRPFDQSNLKFRAQGR